MTTAAAAELVREKAKTAAKEEPAAAVTGKPLSAVFFDLCFKFVFLLISAQYVGTVYLLLKYCDRNLSLGVISAFVTPYHGVMLCAVLELKGVHNEKYAIAHLDAQVADPVPGKNAQAAENV